jgi:hypothetical protein
LRKARIENEKTDRDKRRMYDERDKTEKGQERPGRSGQGQEFANRGPGQKNSWDRAHKLWVF